MKYAAIVMLALFTGCAMYDPVEAIQISPDAKRTCDYAGAVAPRTDDYSSLRVRAACIRYVRDTGRLPPGLRN